MGTANTRARAVLIGGAVAAAAVLGWGLTRFLAGRSHREPAPPAAIASQSPVDLIDLASVALHDCPPAVPPSIPDGSRVTAAQMSAAHAAFQSYDTATNAYVACVDKAVEAVTKHYASVASPAELKSLKAFGIAAHDTAIDQEQRVADELNAQIRTFRAKHPHA